MQASDDLLKFLSWHLASNDSMFSIYRHSLRNKLSILSGRTQVLERIIKTKPTDQQAHLDAVQKILVAVDQLNDMIGTMGKSSSKMPSMEQKTVALSSLVDEAWVVAQEQVRHSMQIEFINEIPTTLQMTTAEGVLSYALVQLLKNSIQFGQGATVHQIRVHAQSREKHHLISVTDSGAGISPAVLEHLFEPFAQKNSGIGLATSHALLKQIDATLNCLTDAPHTTFQIGISSAT